MAETVKVETFHQTVFDVLDTDGDGYLGAHQVREALVAYGMRVALEEFDEALEKLGLRDEYAFELDDIIRIINQIYENRYTALICRIHSVFDAHINKKKKKLPTEEIASYMEEVKIEVEDEDKLNELVAKADPNETGFIDYPSFESIVLALRPQKK